MKKQESLSLPLIKPYAKEGIALHAEEAVQALLDNPYDAPEIIRQSNQTIDSHFNSSITGEYKKTGWRATIALATMGHLVVRNAMLDMLDTHHYFSSLAPPSLDFDTLLLPGDHSTAIQVASNSSYWLRHHIGQLPKKISSFNNPHRLIFEYFSNSDILNITRLDDWQAGPGKNRWPTDKRGTDPTNRLLTVVRDNTDLANSLLCAKAIHHLIHKNSNASSSELYQSTMGAVEQISWQTTGNRHYGWVPDWKELFKNSKRPPGMTPADGLQAFLSIPPSKLTQPNGYASSVEGAAIMQDPDFCLHKALKEGPVAKAGLCPGNIFIAQTDKDTRELARTFFSVLGMDPANGDRYSLGGIVLAMGGVTLQKVILPAFEARKREGANGTL